MSSLRDTLIDEFGLFNSKPIETLDTTNLFIKSGINTIAALAGVGKTTYMNEKRKEWEKIGYTVSYINFDSSPIKDLSLESVESPSGIKGIKDFIRIIKEKANINDIVIIDSLKAMSATCGLDVEENSHMYNLMLELRNIVKTTNCSIILVHHVYRPKNVVKHIDSLYGSRAIEEQSDSAFIYNQTDVKIVKSRSGFSRDEIITL